MNYSEIKLGIDLKSELAKRISIPMAESKSRQENKIFLLLEK